jgi:hypothetical protein
VLLYIALACVAIISPSLYDCPLCVVYLFVISRLRLHTMPRIAFYVRLLPILVSLPLLLLAVRRSLSHRISFVPDLHLVLAYSFVLWYPPSWPVPPIYIPNVCCCCFSSLHLYSATHMTKKTRSSYLQDWRVAWLVQGLAPWRIAEAVIVGVVDIDIVNDETDRLRVVRSLL